MVIYPQDILNYTFLRKKVGAVIMWKYGWKLGKMMWYWVLPLGGSSK